MNRTTCVDASFIVAMLTVERYTVQATSRWKTWLDDDWNIVAPTLLGYEVASALYRKAVQHTIDQDSYQQALQQFLTMDIEQIYMPELHIRAGVLAKKYDRPNTYDAHYLALAEHKECPLWTADERLYNRVKDKFELIRWVDE